MKKYLLATVCTLILVLVSLPVLGYYQKVLWEEGVLDSYYGVATDDFKNVFATGSTVNPFFASESRDENGTARWNDVLISTGRGYGVEIDYSNNALVAGYINDGTNDGILLKYDNTGTQLWNATYDSGGSDLFYSVAIDSYSNAIVTGQVGADAVTRKYTSDGTLVWSETYDSGGTDFGFDVGVDFYDNVYVAGQSNGDFFLQKYDSGGNDVWTQTFNDGGSEYFQQVHVNPDNSVIAVGFSNSRAVIFKYNSAGAVQWVRRIYSGNFPEITVDSDSQIYVARASNMHLDVIGTSNVTVWNNTLYGSGTNVGGITLDLEDNIYVVTNNGGAIHKIANENCTISTTTYDNASNMTSGDGFSYNCVIDSSTVNSSNLHSSTIIGSTLYNVTTTDSYMTDSTIENSSLLFGTLSNTDLMCDGLIIEGDVSAGTLTLGEITRWPYHYFAPFDVDAICENVLPLSGTTTSSPGAVSNGSILTFEFFGSVLEGLDIHVVASELNYTYANVSLYDDGSFPDSSAGDGLYAGYMYIQNDSDGPVVVDVHVNDNRGNNIIFNTTVTIDNTKPNGSISVAGGQGNTSLASVSVDLTYSDDNGINGCRMSNTNLSQLLVRCGFENTLACENPEQGVVPLSNPTIATYSMPSHNFTTGIANKGYNSFTTSDVGFQGAQPIYNISHLFSESTGTLMFWMKPEWAGSESFGATALSIFNRSDDGHYLRKRGTLIEYTWNVSGVEYNLSYDVSSWSADQFHHLAMTYNQVSDGFHEMYFYVDGSLVNSSTTVGGFPVTLENLRVGVGGGPEYTAINATIDELMLFGYVKNANDIQEDYLEANAYAFSSCSASQSWLLESTPGNQTVYYQVKDNAGNINTYSDDIELLISGDTSPPSQLSVSVDEAFSKYTDKLSGSWIAFHGSSAIFYSYRIWNDSANITGWTTAPESGLGTSVTYEGLNLTYNVSYYFEVSACNYNNYCTTATSSTTTIDTIPPSAPDINSSSHTAGAWSTNKSVDLMLNASDDLSDIKGYSYLLDLFGTTDPDTILDTEFETREEYWNVTNYPSDTAYLRAVTLDSTGDVIVAGNVGNSELYVAKYTPEGTLVWNWTASGEDLYGVAVDSNDDIIAVGVNSIPANWAYHIVKINSTGSMLWNWSDNPSGDNDELSAVAIGPGNSIYVVGYDESNGAADQQHVLMSFDADGNNLWNWTDNPSGSADQLNGIAVSDNDELVVVGYDSSAGNAQQLIYNFNTTGHNLWNWTNNPTASSDSFTDVVIDASGNIIASGVVVDSGNLAPHVSKHSYDGTIQWNWTENPTTENDIFYSVDVDTWGRIYAGGVIHTTFDMYMVALETDGSFRWNWTGATASFDALIHVAVETDGDSYLVGYDFSTGDWRQYLGKLSSEGLQERFTTATVALSNLGDGTFYFHGNAQDWAQNWGNSSHFEVKVDSSAPSTPQLLSATSVSGSSNITFKWTEAFDGGSGVDGYYVRVDNDSDFTSPEVETWVGNVTQANLAMAGNGTWYGSVRAINNATLNSSWSSEVSKVIDQIPPNIVMQSPTPGGTNKFSTVNPVFWAQTNELTNCSYTIDGIQNYAFDYTGTYYHEATRELSEGAHTVQFICTDAVGNTNTTGAAEAFTIDTSIRVDSITNFITDTNNYADNLCNASLRILDTNPDPISGMDPARFTLLADSVGVGDLAIQDTGNGYYQMYFTCPEDEGSYTLAATIDGVTATATLDVTLAKFYIQLNGPNSNADFHEHIVYSYDDVSTIGLATDTVKSRLNKSTSPFYLSSQVGKNAYIFLSNEDGRKKLGDADVLLNNLNFFDSAAPTFGHGIEQDTRTLALTLDYDKIWFYNREEIDFGSYKLLVKNNGVFSTGSNAGRTNMSVKVT